MNSSKTHQGYRFDEFIVDTEQRTLRKENAPVVVPSRAFDTLVYLIEHRDRCVSKDEIIGAIWHDVIVTDDSLIHAVSVLRRALGDGRQQPKYIQTVPRRGYRFIAAVEPVGNAPVSALIDAGSQGTPKPASSLPAVAPDYHRAVRSGFARPWIFGCAIAALATIAVFVTERQRPANQTPGSGGIQLFQPAPEGASILSGGVLSPDGRHLAFVARDIASGRTGLWVRALHTSDLRYLDGTDGASKPFWSPDSARLGYFARGRLHAIDVGTESSREIATVFAAGGASWSVDDTILFAEWTSGLYSIPASGDGEVETVATLDRMADDIAFAWPQFFPDGERYLYQVVSLDPERTGIYIGDLETGERFRLIETSSSATLAPPHHILHVDNDLLIAEELDPERMALTGRAMVVARGLSEPSLATENFVSASTDLLAFQHGTQRQNLAWFNRDGSADGAVDLPALLFNPRISPDGSRLLGTSSVTTDPGLWLVRLDREEFSRLSTDAIGGIWSPDGRKVAFTSRSGFEIGIRSVEQPDDARIVATSDVVKILNDWTPNGKRLIYTQHDSATALDLWTIDMVTGSSQPLLASPHSETHARISPDGEWIAYAADESGIFEVYVARYPALTDRRIVSSGGGGQPQWRKDQGELFYLGQDRAVMSVDLPQGNPLHARTARRLFRSSAAGDPGNARDYFAVNADGTRFLVDGTVSENDGRAITVMVNWSKDFAD
jgi:DNA-binding winged helix-turn-helix (wHTH) protein/Tol biopolymer transport system component